VDAKHRYLFISGSRWRNDCSDGDGSGTDTPGGWATTDNIPDVAYVRDQLAVTPECKPDVSHVQTFQIPEGVQLQHGTVGPQTCGCQLYSGGGSQVQILNFKDRAKLIPIGEPRPIR